MHIWKYRVLTDFQEIHVIFTCIIMKVSSISDMVLQISFIFRLRCLCFEVSVSMISFILSGGCVTGLGFLDIRRDVVFVGLKSTNHEVTHLFIVSNSILRLCAADCVFSTIMYRLVSSAKRRIDEFILRTLSFI